MWMSCCLESVVHASSAPPSHMADTGKTVVGIVAAAPCAAVGVSASAADVVHIVADTVEGIEVQHNSVV